VASELAPALVRKSRNKNSLTNKSPNNSCAEAICPLAGRGIWHVWSLLWPTLPDPATRQPLECPRRSGSAHQRARAGRRSRAVMKCPLAGRGILHVWPTLPPYPATRQPLQCPRRSGSARQRPRAGRRIRCKEKPHKKSQTEETLKQKKPKHEKPKQHKLNQ
jgi:hypothetical protein